MLYPRCNATPSPPSPYAPLPRAGKPPRSSADLPRRALDLPRSIPVLPRSPVKVPRSILVLPRSGFALPRFAAKPSAARVADRLRSPEGCASSRVLGFTFPHPTGLFTPVAAFCRDTCFCALHFMGVFTPVAAPPRRIRASLGPARFTRVATQRQVPQPPKVPRSLGLRFCRGACFRKVPRHAPTTTDRAAPRSVVVRGRVPQASPSRGTILAVRRE